MTDDEFDKLQRSSAILLSSENPDRGHPSALGALPGGWSAAEKAAMTPPGGDHPTTVHLGVDFGPEHKPDPIGVLIAIAYRFPARQADLVRLSAAYRRELTLENARRYVLALEALVATALRAEAFSPPSPPDQERD